MTDKKDNHMPRPMRNKGRQTTDEETRRFLAEAEFGILCTAGEDNQPYGVPVNFVSDDNAVYIHAALEGHKLDNIKTNPKVCFTVAGGNKIIPAKFSTYFESVVVFGTAEIITGEAVKEPLIMLVKKLDPDHMSEGKAYIDSDFHKTSLIKITVDHMTGKARR